MTTKALKIDKKSLFDDLYRKNVLPTSTNFKEELIKLICERVSLELNAVLSPELHGTIETRAQNFFNKIKSIWVKKAGYHYEKAIKYVNGSIFIPIVGQNSSDDAAHKKPPDKKRKDVTIPAKSKGRPRQPHSIKTARGQRNAASKARKMSGNDADLFLHAANQASNDKALNYVLKKVRKEPSLAAKLKAFLKEKGRSMYYSKQ